MSLTVIWGFALWDDILAQTSANSDCPQWLKTIEQITSLSLCSNPIAVKVALFLSLILLTTATIAVLTGNLNKIRENVLSLLNSRGSGSSAEEIARARLGLIERMKGDVARRQHDSLPNLIKIDLQLEEQLNQIGRPQWELASDAVLEEQPRVRPNRFFRLLRGRDHPDASLTPKQKVIDFFEREDIQGRLLVLGEPGSGKTTELLDLAKDLLDRDDRKANASIPVILELSSWSSSGTIEQWLVDQLRDTYGLRKD